MSKPHEGHRERMRNRFRTEGLENFADHEILELMLYYVLPQKNTNEVAHELIKAFGSFDKVLEAGIGSLIQVKGIKESSAVYLNIICGVIRRYEMLKNTEKNLSIRNIDDVGNFLVHYYTGMTVERFIALLFDRQNRLSKIVIVSEGDANGAQVNIQNILHDAIVWESAAVVVAHNHPSGELMPSPEDYITTQKLTRAFDLMEMNFIDHILVAGNKFLCLKKSLEL